jgi:hypothetical protein
MKYAGLVLFPLILVFPVVRAVGQSAGGAAVAPALAPATASSLLGPALARLHDSLQGLRLDKWKAPGAVREETDANIGSINRDLTGPLPGLLANADAAPGILSRNLPVFRNVDALYDVLLRVVETADLAAPEKETDTLHGALSALDDARRNLGDALESAAVRQEAEAGQLREQVQAARAVVHTVTPTVVADGVKREPATTHKHKAKVEKKPEE